MEGEGGAGEAVVAAAVVGAALVPEDGVSAGGRRAARGAWRRSTGDGGRRAPTSHPSEDHVHQRTQQESHHHGQTERKDHIS